MQQELEMSALCKKCPAGYYRDNIALATGKVLAGCSPCPAGSSSEAGSSDKSACKCAPGFAAADKSGNPPCSATQMLKEDLPAGAESEPAVPPRVITENFKQGNGVACEDNLQYQDFNCSLLKSTMPNGTNCTSYAGDLCCLPLTIPWCLFPAGKKVQQGRESAGQAVC